MAAATQAELVDLVGRIRRMRGPYLGDGINPGFTTTELLAALEPLIRGAAEPPEAPA